MADKNAGTMIRWLLGAVLTALLAVSSHSALASDKPLTNQDVVAMVKAGLDESTILMSIGQSKTDFSTDPMELIQLKEAGVSDSVIRAMMSPGSPEATAAMPTAGAPGSMPQGFAMPPMGPQGITAIDGDRRVELRMSTYAQKPKKKFWSNNMVAILPDARSSIRLSSRTPRFEVGIPQNVPLAPEELFRLMSTTVRGDTREFELMVVTYSTMKRSVPEVTKGVVETTLELSSDSPPNAIMQTYVLSPVAPLEPGEYAVVQYGTQVWDFGVD